MRKNKTLLSRFYSKSIRHTFSEREDEQLKKLVSEYGDQDWKIIADCLGSRTPRQCRERYKNYLMPGIVNGEWTEVEDKLLQDKYNEIGPHWTMICKFFPTRSEINIKNRWASISKRGLRKKNVQSNTAISELKNEKVQDMDLNPRVVEKIKTENKEEQNELDFLNALEDDLYSFGISTNDDSMFTKNSNNIFFF